MRCSVTRESVKELQTRDTRGTSSSSPSEAASGEARGQANHRPRDPREASSRAGQGTPGAGGEASGRDGGRGRHIELTTELCSGHAIEPQQETESTPLRSEHGRGQRPRSAQSSAGDSAYADLDEGEQVGDSHVDRINWRLSAGVMIEAPICEGVRLNNASQARRLQGCLLPLLTCCILR